LGTEMGTRGPDPRDREIAKRLRVLRLQRNWSQAELANALSVTAQQVQKYERGANRITAGRLARIAEILEVSVMYFYGDNRQQSSAGAHAVEFDFLQTKGAVRLVRAYSRIAKTGIRLQLLKLAEELAAG
jgi:transcriptional regulator with XRE-family HTH domain